MRYVFSGILSFLMLLGVCPLAVPARAATVEPDVETHRVLGTLCALSAAANLYGTEGGTLSAPAQLERYFQRESLPEGWPDSVRVEARSDSWWVGVPVGIASTARKFLRAHAPELRIFAEPGGPSWMGSPFVWLEALRFGAGKKPEPFGVGIAEGRDGDRAALFFNTPGTEWYWWSPLTFTASARASLLKRWGREAGVPELTVPREGDVEKESFRASPVGLPEEFGVSSDREPGTSVEMGDVLFNPIPRPRTE